MSRFSQVVRSLRQQRMLNPGHAISCTLIAFAVLLAANRNAIGAELPDLSGIAALGVSGDYSLVVDDHPVPVLETTKTTNHGTNDVNRMAFAGFDCDGVATVRLIVERAFQSYEVRPRRSGIEVARDGKTLSFSMQPTQHIAIVFEHNYDNALVISANPKHQPPPPSEVQHYFAPGVHTLPGRLALSNGDRVYLAEGAIVLGALDLKDVRDMQIFGRGIVYGGETPHQENYRVFAGDNTKDVSIEGITVCNAPGWIISFWNGSENLTVRNVKMVGNFRYNTDGVQTGTRGLRVEDCFLQCNDDNFSLNGVCTDVTIRRNVLWNLYNGGVFMLGWATGQRFHLENLRIHDNTVIRCGGCCDYDRKGPFSMKLFGSKRTARDIEFRKIVLEDIAAFGRWIDLQASKAADCEIKDIRFCDIQIDATWLAEGEIRGMSESNRIEGLVFENVRIGDRLMDRPEVGGLSLVNTLGTTIQGQAFEDQVLEAQPIPASAAAMATQPGRDETRDPQGEHPSVVVSTTPPTGLGPNLLANGDFAAGTDGWILPPSDRGSTAWNSEKDGETWLAVTGRRDSSVGIQQDITKILREYGPGNYQYRVAAKAVSEPLHIKVTLIVEDEHGVQQHPSPDIVVDDETWGAAERRQPLNWGKLTRAILKVESGYGDKHDLLIREVSLKR